MSIQGVDLASRLDAASAAGLARAGKRFVCRYLSTAGNAKNLQPGEPAVLHKAGLSIVLVFETTANRALGGHSAGMLDALSAASQAKALGAGPVQPIYFAVDFDATPGEQAAVNAYLLGASAVIGRSRVGIYGGYWPVSRALDARACAWAWQTYAWSGGQWDKRAHIRQYQNSQHVAGLSVDLDEAMFSAYGQWAPPGSPQPAPKPSTPPRGWVVHFTRRDGTRTSARTLHPVLWHTRNPRCTNRGPLSFERP